MFPVGLFLASYQLIEQIPVTGEQRQAPVMLKHYDINLLFNYNRVCVCVCVWGNGMGVPVLLLKVIKAAMWSCG